ncbi:DNA alkylation repair protein [Pelodictyon phaeoclathratiforme]|jgi:3-methyladenine DNA glycosylase AlkD|uniref:DNA alkylation repair enzyme n=1 Tax=Pelodictyon phaeoclathratiforme (strain DSM 5477 / BU-1) TaxID=324925 RepID=B4SBJ9_PELPB|nr:DNA alkylation repair protein [Pelodictyon phaeoclathratiforme]ACF44053.1 DNA alkylation repair enzyme [Pelodictyon phaeoclathratiforme BU-1]MBV5288266.1 DNA alkylation repair protein [Pelodictyon phaeoclathratiforme]
MSGTASMIMKRLEALSNPEAARFAQRFFKTGPGEYAEGDLFRGIRVPVLRKLSLTVDDVPMPELILLLESAFHEDRLLALLMLMRRFIRGDEPSRKRIYDIYLAHTRCINNWDLVDISAPHIVGSFLHDHPRTSLLQLADSERLWERRIAIIATFHFIRLGEFQDTLALGEKLLQDPEELIHKATGWMLREVGKRNLAALEDFLSRHYQRMPRVMLRYAIERFPEARRLLYLKGNL